MMMKKDVRARLFELIDEEDCRLLTAVGLLESATISELYSFTKRFYTFLELHNRIGNLQQRLLLFIEYPEDRSRSGEKTIRLNPVFEEKLVREFLNSELVFPTLTKTENRKLHPWFCEQLFAAFISFISADSSLFGGNGNRRKKAENRFSDVFASVTGRLPDGLSLPELLFGSAEELGFVTGPPDSFRIDYDSVKTFGSLDGREKSLRIAASAAVYLHRDEHRLPPSASDTAYMIISSLLSSFSAGSSLSREDLTAALYLIKRELGSSYTGKLSGEIILEALCLTGFLDEDGDQIVFSFEPGSIPETGTGLRIQSNFEMSAPAGFSLSAEITAALCGRISAYDITRTYVIEKKPFAAALEAGLSIEKITAVLKEISVGGIPQNVLFSMKSWEKEYSSISLNYGVVMTVDSARLPLIKHSPQLTSFFLASPAPGVFILDPAKENAWRRAFADAGFDILPSVNTAGACSPAEIAHEFKQNRFSASEEAEASPIGFYDSKPAPAGSGIIEELIEKLNRKPLSEENKARLKARIKKKLLLADSQLTASARPEERGEAGGLDHQAKIRLAERAIELDNLLEITTASDFELEKRLVKPGSLIKTPASAEGKPPIYRIEGIELPDENEVLISINRISYLKMLKSSLYTP